MDAFRTGVIKMHHIETMDDMVEALGGMPQLLRVTGRAYKDAHKWVRKGSMPAKYHHLMSTVLAERGYTADPALWVQELPCMEATE